MYNSRMLLIKRWVPTEQRGGLSTWIIMILCILGGTAIMFAFDNYFGFWDDETYQTLCVIRYREAPLGVLSFYIGKIWTDIFGLSMLNLRYLTSTEVILTVAVSTCYLYRLTRRRLLSGFSFLLGCILMKLTSFYFYNWDIGSYLFDSIAICLLISLISRPSTIKYLLFGVSVGLMTLGRAPSGIFLALSIIPVVCSLRHSDAGYRPLKAVMLIVAGWLGLMIILTALILGSPEEYIRQYAEGNVVSGHSLSDLKALWHRLMFITDKTVSGWFISVGCMLIAVLLTRMRSRKAMMATLLPWLLICIFYEYVKAKYFLELPLVLGGDTPVGLGLLLACPLYCLFKHSNLPRKLSLKILAVLLLYGAMAFGSDAYVERMTAGFTVPLIVGIVWRSDMEEIRKYVKYSLGVCIIVFGLIFSFLFFYFHHYYAKYGKVETLGPYQGIWVKNTFPPEIDKLEKVRMMGEAIEVLKRENARISVIGDHMIAQLVYDYDDALTFHEFHLGLNEEFGWEKYKNSVMQEADAFVIPANLNFDYKKYREDLKEGGFTDEVRIGEALVFYRAGFRPH